MRAISKAELFLLVAFFFVLPMYEGPKNLLLVAYIISWCMQSWRAKDFGGKLRSWEWVLVLFLAAGFISAHTNPFGWDKPVSGALTFAKLIIPALLISRTSIPTPKVTLLGSSIVLGTLIAILESWYVWNRDGGEYPELHSVGHVNQSALYIAIAFGVSLSLFMFQKGWIKGLSAIATLFFAIAMVPTISITAVAVIAAMAIAAIFMQFRPDRKHLTLLTASVVIIGISLFVASNHIPKVNSFKANIAYHMQGGDTGSSFLSKRDVIFNSVIYVLSDFPMFGAGDRHFDIATSEEYMESVAAQRGTPYESERFFHTNHGHNMVASVLLNRGYVGLFLMLAFILIAAWKHLQWLIQYYSERKLELEPVIGIMTGIYIIVGGMGNSTLYVEHGQLAFCLIGLSMGYLQRKTNRKLIDAQTYSISEHSIKKSSRNSEDHVL
ncbi:O-antigen ligase [Endozoicomonas sp. SCSIO W0465]|uniref:O-antigen ligase family protein n=1 Tax=Endozoicomonas sp. SCSIO W0465 TaxID=2918516 RepID=UPI002076443B|nr:O-antigen ligase family protein [Endozoicomonas sp. SCSIO W0465]USE37487.1 O-antigen ligase family protein [Endozoicomonas sp. SCSIO W0465]